MSRVWIPRQDLTLAVIALLFVVCTNPARGEGVRIERGQVRIVLASSPQKNALTASIRTSFVLHNTSDRADGARRVFPIAAPLTWRHQRTGMTWCSVAVDDELVEATTEALLDSQSRVRGQPDDKQHILWSERIDKWIEEDDVLLELVTRFRKLTESRREINDVTEEFQQRARRHLIHADDLDYTVVYVASGDSFFGHLVKLMPEIDPKLRIDGEHRRWKYVSILNEFDPELYRPYEQAWRSQFDKWISSKPELAELSPKLRDVWGSLRESQELLHGPILKHLHDVNQLDLITSQEMASFIDRGGQSPTTSLVRKMFPDIRRQLDAKDEAATKQLSKWGFDESTISPFTGRLTPRRDAQPLAVRDFWRDPSVLAQLGRPSPPPQRRGRARRELYVPVLVSFDAPLKAGETAAVTLEHEIDLVPLVHPLSSSFRTGGSALSTVFPAAGNVAVTVTCPAGIQPIIAPAPHTIDVAKDGLRTFHGRLGGDATMVHLAPVDLTKDGAPWLSRFPNRDGRVHQDLSELIEKTRNRTVRPLLMSALYSSLLDAKKPWEAEQLAAR
ncbi:MAG: hypothetical protein QF805_06425, partial [Pirellulaceae bacterium]|nr:hypothetical protein [Pirellulaceae bacterium]